MGCELRTQDSTIILRVRWRTAKAGTASGGVQTTTSHGASEASLDRLDKLTNKYLSYDEAWSDIGTPAVGSIKWASGRVSCRYLTRVEAAVDLPIRQYAKDQT